MKNKKLIVNMPAEEMEDYRDKINNINNNDEDSEEEYA